MHLGLDPDRDLACQGSLFYLHRRTRPFARRCRRSFVVPRAVGAAHGRERGSELSRQDPLQAATSLTRSSSSAGACTPRSVRAPTATQLSCALRIVPAMDEFANFRGRAATPAADRSGARRTPVGRRRLRQLHRKLQARCTAASNIEHVQRAGELASIEEPTGGARPPRGRASAATTRPGAGRTGSTPVSTATAVSSTLRSTVTVSFP